MWVPEETRGPLFVITHRNTSPSSERKVRGVRVSLRRSCPPRPAPPPTFDGGEDQTPSASNTESKFSRKRSRGVVRDMVNRRGEFRCPSIFRYTSEVGWRPLSSLVRKQSPPIRCGKILPNNKSLETTCQNTFEIGGGGY